MIVKIMKTKIWIGIIILISFTIGIIFTHNNLFSLLQKPNSIIKKPLAETRGLNQFYQWTKEDPVFTSPDFDSQQFLTVVNGLEIEEKSIQDFLKTKDPIYPVAFLKSVSEVNRLHKEFMVAPLGEKAWELLYSYKKTVQDYQAAQASLAKVFRNEKLFPPDRFFVGINTRVSFRTIRDDIDKLGLNAVELKTEINKRENCLKTAHDCQIPAESFTFNEDFNVSDPKVSQQDFLPKDVLFLGREKGLEQFGPYIISTACFGWSPDLKPIAYPFYVSDKFPSGMTGLDKVDLKLATTKYYKKLEEDPEGAGAYLLKSDSPLIVQKETKLYICNDLTYLVNLVTLDKFYRSYKNLPLFEEILKINYLSQDVKQITEKGELLEEAFLKEEFPSENNAKNLASFYAYFYKMLGIWNNKYPTEPWINEANKNKEEFLKRSLEYQRKMGNINFLMTDSLQEINQIKAKFSIANKANNTYSYIFGFRTFYGLFYLAFSPSFYRLNEPLSFIDKKRVEVSANSKGAYITYQQALQNYTPEEIAKWEFNQQELLDQAVEEFKAKHPDAKF